MEVVTKKLKMGDVGDQVDGKMEPLKCQDGVEIEIEDTEMKPAEGLGNFGIGIFPEELWLQILEKLTRSQDILNVFKAFPELDKAFQNKKACWLFDQVLPHLMTKHLVTEKNNTEGDYVISRDLLKLRLVSKRWKNAVEWSLENHADLRNPSNCQNGKQSTCSAVGLPIHHFNYNRIDKTHLGATVFRKSEQISDFLNEMTDFQGNPFPGKHVYFESNREGGEPYPAFLFKAVELLQKFGEHVLILSWEIGDGNESHLKTYKAIVDGLWSVRNLMSLKISGYLINCDDAEAEIHPKYLLPRLEKLESFEWMVSSGPIEIEWVDYIIGFYGKRHNKLRRLALDHKFWNKRMAAKLVNLTELHLLLDGHGSEDYDLGDLRYVLQLFPNGQLKKFCLRDYLSIKETREIYIDELIGMVDKFHIETVVFEKMNLKEKVSEMDEAVGITSLYLDDCLGLSYEFLKRIPNLRFLNVHVPFTSVEEFTQPEGEYDEDAFGFKVRQYFWNFNKRYEWRGDRSFSIWKECEKLEMLSVSVVEGYTVFDVQFVREHGNKPFWGWSEPEDDESWLEDEEGEQKEEEGEEEDDD